MDKNIIKNRVKKLQELISINGIDAYIIVTDDFHSSEYVGEYFKEREFISGFDGSAGTLVVTKDSARLWTDGRYFLQASQQLEGTDIKLMKQAEKGVPTIEEFLVKLPGDCVNVGFDGRTIKADFANSISGKFEEANKKVQFKFEKDLVDEIWAERPALASSKAYLLTEDLVGESRASKLKRVRAELAKKRVDACVICSLDDIAWLLNVRGNDVEYNPVLLSYLLILKDSCILYCNENAFSQIDKDSLAKDGVKLSAYDQVYEDLSKLTDKKLLAEGKGIYVDTIRSNYRLLQGIDKKVKLVKDTLPTVLMKAIKNDIEVKNIREAHIIDAVAVIKLLCFLDSDEAKEKISKGELTELDVSEMLLNFRKEGSGYLDQSFAPIIASASNGAIIHYEPTKETNKVIENNNFLLMDTGAQYYKGTTDITRTAVIGEVTDEMKLRFTLVLKGNLDLGAAIFREGTTGANLDVIARSPIWEYGLNYNHGTGHGVGFLLNVHEGPQNIRLAGANGTIGCPMKEGMITSNEPGLYFDGEYGIRHENLTLTKKKMTTSYGDFLEFETLTLVPFDKRGIDVSLLSKKERELLDEYHELVYKKISPLLGEKENAWLKNATSPISETFID